MRRLIKLPQHTRPWSLCIALAACTGLFASSQALAEAEADCASMIKAGQYAQALPLVEKDLQKDYFSIRLQLAKAQCLQKLNRWEDAESPLMMVGIKKDLARDDLYNYCLLRIEQDKHFHQDASLRQVCDCLIDIDSTHADKWRMLKKAHSKPARPARVHHSVTFQKSGPAQGH